MYSKKVFLFMSIIFSLSFACLNVFAEQTDNPSNIRLFYGNVFNNSDDAKQLERTYKNEEKLLEKKCTFEELLNCEQAIEIDNVIYKMNFAYRLDDKDLFKVIYKAIN